MFGPSLRMTKGKAKESEDTDVVEGPTPNEEETDA